MDTPASKLIDAFGGTSKTAKLAGLPISTVHSWRSNGIPQSRLAHLKLVARVAKLPVDFETLAQGVTPPKKTPTEARAA